MTTRVISMFAGCVLGWAGCAGELTGGGSAGDASSGVDAGPADPEADAGGALASCDDRAVLPLGADRPVDLMPADRLARVAARMPCVVDPRLAPLLESPDTMWYDRFSIVPGYQDSFGDNVVLPLGMRPNTIDPELIDLAVPGGHGWIFQEPGTFHFPFGKPGGFGDTDGFVVDFWHVPREAGALLPVVWWMREPSAYTHRIEWLFPVGTTFGEILFVVASDGEWFPFEIRTRTRAIDRWTVEVYRPFPTAQELAAAIESRRGERSEWASSAELDELVAHLGDDGTLAPGSLAATHFDGAFDRIDGVRDVLPALDDASILRELLVSTPFRSARGVPWKQRGGDIAWAPTSEGGFSIVPRGYNGGFLDVNDQVCSRCHEDAGRPFKDWHEDIIAYGELWGQDEIFSWHPFENATFVDASGAVVDFNYDNRTFRGDLEPAGLLEEYRPSIHDADTWREIARGWKNYVY